MASSNFYTRWVELTDDELTVDNVQDILGQISDDSWVAAACYDRLVDNVDIQRTLLQVGIKRTQSVFERVNQLLPGSSGSDANTEQPTDEYPLSEYFESHSTDAQLCYIRKILLERMDRLNTFNELRKEAPDGLEEEYGSATEDVDWEDDPWAEEPSARPSKAPPFTLSEFLTADILHSAYKLAFERWFEGLRVLLEKHSKYLWPFRYAILDSIPGYTPPSDYHFLLPSCSAVTNMEQTPTSKEWRLEPDWSEAPVVTSTVKSCRGLWDSDVSQDLAITRPHPQDAPLSAEQVSAWYNSRVEAIMSSTGMIDTMLAIVQHGASHGVPLLDELGEELSLLSRLVYDTPRSDKADEDWTLARWREMDPPAVVRAYLSRSSPSTLARDISRLVMPYLFVLESRAERAGKPDPSLPTRLLHEYILNAPLEMAAAVFEASKPTLPPAQRLIKEDDVMVRLALSCLYGSDSLTEWSTMSRIFECLPAWDIPGDDSEEDAADTTIASLGTFVTPSTTRPRCTPSDLLIFFGPLPVSSLSRALDILDVHLESGEILSRWSVPAPLRWFLQSSGDASEQRSWANRMSRRAGGSEDRLDTMEDWEWLLEDMLKLNGREDSKLQGAFGLLSRDEILRIYFSGLLSAGKFDVAKTLLYSRKNQLVLDPQIIEDICLSSSREFYDNASSGNYNFGDMKLAYECLDVPMPSDRITREKEFIEATSRLSSFNVMSRPGTPISPIEIRLTKDRLSLVSRVLSSNSDAYKHTEVILDLVYKLGFRNDIVAEVKTLAMLADTALQAEDFTRAYETSKRMVDTVLNLRMSSIGMDDPKIVEASEVCWVACFQLGRQSEFDNTDQKLSLLGRAIEICPSDRLHDVLTAWRRLEKEDIEAREERLLVRPSGVVESDHQKRTKRIPESATESLQTRLRNFHLPSPPLLNTPDAAALASKTFRSVTANFPFSVGGQRGRSQLSQQGEGRSNSGSRGPEEDVSSQASRVFSKGIGWLIGADENL
ncbi:Sec39-domain-containing protein [Dendrothele bispora CBS 962.96]|uniref:Sec39-domain-containing protein n=1 Tax=Dendrothele bispora (strain CBS 962.96) TaxID=1314807 RepID=A0A4S8MX11_DENBC|nr:Sec39-domain-containing protein [Dendrothele bispora CBS 962.96]